MIITALNPGTETLLRTDYKPDPIAKEASSVSPDQAEADPEDKTVLGLNPQTNLARFMTTRKLSSVDQITDDHLAALDSNSMNKLCLTPCYSSGEDPDNQVINFIARVAQYFQDSNQKENLINVLANHFRDYAGNYGSRRNSPIEPLRPVLNKMSDDQIGELLAATVKQGNKLPSSTVDRSSSISKHYPNIGLGSMLSYARQRLGYEDSRIQEAVLEILTLESEDLQQPSPNEELVDEKLFAAIPEADLKKKGVPPSLHTVKLLLKRFDEGNELFRLVFARYMQAMGADLGMFNESLWDSVQDRAAEVLDTLSPDTRLAIANTLVAIDPRSASSSWGHEDINQALSWLYQRIINSDFSPEQKTQLTLDILRLDGPNARVVEDDLTLIPEDEFVEALYDLPEDSLEIVLAANPYPYNAEIQDILATV